MANIFKQQKDYVEKPNRNVFDLSHSNNLTFNFGELIPIECRPVFPGDTIDLDMSAALKFMPLTFPVQTPIKLNVDAFYVRSRTLWDKFMDKITNVDTDPVTPYIRPAGYEGDNYNVVNHFFSTGSLADYLGVPSTISGYMPVDYDGFDMSLFSSYSLAKWTTYTNSTNANRQGLSLWPQMTSWMINEGDSDNFFSEFYKDSQVNVRHNGVSGMATSDSVPVYEFRLPYSEYKKYGNSDSRIKSLILHASSSVGYKHNGFGSFKYGSLSLSNAIFAIGVYVLEDNLNMGVRVYQCAVADVDSIQFNGNTIVIPSNIPTSYLGGAFYTDDGVSVPLELDEGLPTQNMRDSDNIPVVVTDDSVIIIQIQVFSNYPDSSAHTSLGINDLITNSYIYGNTYFYVSESLEAELGIEIVYDSLLFVTPSGSVRDVNGLHNFANPFGGASGDLKINALPFRAYEAIYNSYYRNERVDPLLDSNNKPIYNQYVVNRGDGADTYPYQIHHCNWDLDFLTSAVASPQLGVAPLVGVQGNGDFIFEDENSNIYKMTPLTGPDGDTIVGIQSYTEGTPIGSLRLMMDSINQGISISDFRNVNAFQRYLERAIRRGLKYVDIIKSQFGTDMQYKAVDMPEYIGGFSQMVSVNQVNQSVATDEFPLGAYAGQGNIFGKSSNHIHHYCDEHGYLLIIARVQPMAMYSQVLPKHFLYRDTLDWFAPAFNHISMQPILYQEVCPLQVAYFRDKNQTDTFGYQRPWYDLVSAVDEVHGEFRTSLRNFLVNRVFSESPELGREFIQVNEQDLNDVFSVQDTSDKILGSFYFDEQITRSVSKIAIPSIE